MAETRTPEGKHFLIITRDDERFELIYQENLDQWTIQPKPPKERA